IWAEVLHEAQLPHFLTGSLHVVYRDDDAAVAQEFAGLAPWLGYECQWLDARGVLEPSQAVRSEQLLGGLWSGTELTVDPRITIAVLPAFLSERYDVQFRFAT